MVVNGRPLKRAKRRVTADLHDFLTFPLPSAAGGSGGDFRSSVRSFLARHCRLPPPASSVLSPLAVTSVSLLTWRVTFRIGKGEEEGDGMGRRNGVVEMDVVEEDVRRSRSVYCDQCRVVGWSGHPVCGKRYHFIIRSEINPIPGYHQMCTRCGSLLHMLDSRCVSCKYEMTVEDYEDWAYRQLDDATHLLHGVVHANGYGHLLRVNGREGGSKCLTGCDIMSFWDRLCKMLHVRKVTVMDISKKYGVEYRLLHAVTAGHPWYGDWGYKFGAGSYAVTSDAYKKAVETLSRIPLSFFFSQARSPRTSLQNTIALYWSLSDRQLETVRGLFCYVTKLLHNTHEQSQTRTISKKKIMESNASALCTWTKDDVEKVEEKMVKILRVAGRSRWVTWHALRGAVCQSVSSPELLDYCLKDLGGKTIADMVVSVRCSPKTSAIEYRVEAASNRLLPTQNQRTPSAEQLSHDLKYLYDAILNPATMHEYKPKEMSQSAISSATKLLDCKQFIKHYDEPASKLLQPSNPFALQVLCYLELLDQPKDYTAPPPELLVLPVAATVADLKILATKAFQETYLIFQRLQVEQLLEYEYVNDCTNVKLLIGRNAVVKVIGRCQGDERRLGQFRMERGLENWIVDCRCGAKDDDGERMMACDTCAVWHHTRCAGVSDYEAVPVKFVCKKCSGNKNKSNGIYTSNKRCKDEVTPSSMNISRGYGHMSTVG
ncbi:putative PHD finger protein [Iris pallida]|uniref:PHD finger protein n=1 Tax=Iris pallida TaxID=29817 RepID=A0AAX6EAU2_IRIPA|nr:putative PHD finger protein [Iris pallida]